MTPRACIPFFLFSLLFSYFLTFIFLSIFQADVPLLTASSHHFVVSRCVIRDLGLRCILQRMETTVYTPTLMSTSGHDSLRLRLAAWQPRRAFVELSVPPWMLVIKMEPSLTWRTIPKYSQQSPCLIALSSMHPKHQTFKSDRFPTRRNSTCTRVHSEHPKSSVRFLNLAFIQAK